MSVRSELIKISEKKLLPFAVVVFFALIYLLISAGNHINFRTYALDLGVFNQALWSYAHLSDATYTLDIIGTELPFFATHFSPLIFLFVPGYFVFGSYTLLLVQIAAILLGGIGVFRYSVQTLGNKALSIIVMVSFYSFFGIVSAVSFDFHFNVVAAMLVPWFLLFIKNGDRWKSIALFTLILMAQENMALWMVFIIAGILLMPGKVSRDEKLFRTGLLITALIYFIVVMEFIVPFYNPDKINQLSRYTALGGSLSEILGSIFSHPMETIGMLFKNTLEDSVYNGIKAEFHIMVLLAGGLFLLFRPWYLIMLLPVYAWKFFSSDYALWGINFQYSIEFIPIITFAVIDTLALIREEGRRVLIALVTMLITIGSTIAVIESRRSLWYRQVDSRFYSKEHYQSGFNTPKLREALSLIPDRATISVSSELASHLEKRERMYLFPIVKDAEYIILLTRNCSYYPLTEESFAGRVLRLKNSSEYQIVSENEECLVLKK